MYRHKASQTPLWLKVNLTPSVAHTGPVYTKINMAPATTV